MVTAEEFQQRVLAELAAVKADNVAIKAENAAELAAVKADNEHLRAEMQELRASSAVTAVTVLRPDNGPANRPTENDRGRMSRSQFLRLGGAAAAGAVAVGASGLLRASPAAAQDSKGSASGATGNALLIGQSNSPTTPTDTTKLVDPSTTVLSPLLMRVDNYSSTSLALPPVRIALAGTTSGNDGDGLTSRVGVWGQVDRNGIGVMGRQGTTAALPSGSAGVVGEGADGGTGVFGRCDGEGGVGVSGLSSVGIGVVAGSGEGLALHAGGTGRIFQHAQRVGPPIVGSGTFSRGEQVRDLDGELWLCVASGSPGTWRRAATVREGFAGGSVNVLEKPIRLYDSRNTPGGILAAGATRDVQVTEVFVGPLAIPAGAKAVFGNITVVATGAGGYLTLFPQASPPSPLTASINWFATNQVLNTSALVRINPTNGQIGVGNGLGGGSTSTHFVFDASGFVF